MNADGSGRRQLTSGSTDHYPSVSPDGQYIVFASTRSGGPNLWRIDIDGDNLRQLTSDGSEDNRPRYTPDGKWIVFQSWRSGKASVWKMPVEGGEAIQLTNMMTINPTPSPDGKLVACMDIEAPPSVQRILLLPIDGGEPERVIELPPNTWRSVLEWTLDERAIMFRDGDGVYNIWRMPIQGGQPLKLTNFKLDPAAIVPAWMGSPSYALSPDGKQFAITRTTVASDVVLISNFN
jgi:Tol biopolymer transport system component